MRLAQPFNRPTVESVPVSLSDALHAAVATFRRRPGDLLPFYMLGAAVPGIARVGTFLGLGVAYAYLEVTGRLDVVRADLVGRDLNPPDPERTEAFAEWVTEVTPLVEPLFPPAVLLVLAVGLLLTLASAIVLAAAASAGQIATCEARLRDERGLTAGISGLSRYWRPFLAAYVVEAAIWLLASAVALALVAGTAALSRVALIVVAPVAFLAWLAVVVTTRAVFAFVPVTIVVDDSGLGGAVRGSGGFIRREPVGAVTYYAVALGTLLAFSTLAGVLTLVETQAIVAPLAFLAMSPALDLVKTGLYVADRGELSPPAEPVPGLRDQVSSGVRRGLVAVPRFVRDAPGLHLLALALGVGGGVVGWVAAEPLVGVLDTSIAERLADHVPPLAALNYFANNWTVAISTALSGVALAVPAGLSVWFNGVVLGVVARLEVTPIELAAFVLPHGVFEIPAIIVAGALGVHLGVVTWRAWRGRVDRTGLADALERAFWVLVGLGVVLAAAGLVEGFVSPYYWRVFI